MVLLCSQLGCKKTFRLPLLLYYFDLVLIFNISVVLEEVPESVLTYPSCDLDLTDVHFCR